MRRKKQYRSPKVRQQIRELNERLKEQFIQDRRERFLQFRNWLKEIFYCGVERCKFSDWFWIYNPFVLCFILIIFANITYYFLVFGFAILISNKFGIIALIGLSFTVVFPWKDFINLLQSLTRKK